MLIYCKKTLASVTDTFKYDTHCVCQGRPSYEWTKHDVSQKFKAGGIKPRDQPISTQNLVS